VIGETRGARAARLRAWADESEFDGYAFLTRHPPSGLGQPPRRFGSATAFATGRQSGFFNPILVLEPVAAADLSDAIEWVRGLGLAFTLRVRDDVDDRVVRQTARKLGLTRDAWVEPALVLEPVRRPPTIPPGLSIEVATPATQDRFYAANAAAFDLPRDSAFVRDLTPPEVIEDPAIRLFGGYLDNEPVACSFAIRSEHVVGIYAVGTATPARRRGIATAMTWAAVAAGFDWGCAAATLQASKMGEPVYRAMGFEQVGGYVTYDQPRPRGGEPAA
jgi:GNAT superfamily N-acetyltransferase